MSDRPSDSAPPPGDPPVPPPPGGLESTAFLLDRVRGGDAAARERLVARFLPALRRWAAGRLPGYARATMDTDDLVQVSLLRALEHVEGFEVRREGAFLAYLRRILLNAVRDEIRRASRRPSEGLEGLDLADPAPSPLERQVGRDMLETYEDALTRLTEGQREAVIMRLEFGYSYPQIAEAMGRDANAARMLVARALVKLAEEMDEHRDG